jgi:hypothetical protein
MVPLALVPVVVRVEHPLDFAHPHLGEVVEDAARAKVDQEPAVPPDEEIDVARVAVPVEARRQPDERARVGREMGMGVPVAPVSPAGIVVRMHPRPPVEGAL